MLPVAPGGVTVLSHDLPTQRLRWLYCHGLVEARALNVPPIYAACMVPGLAFVRFVPVLPGSSPGRGFFLGAECCKGCAQEG